MSWRRRRGGGNPRRAAFRRSLRAPTTWRGAPRHARQDAPKAVGEGRERPTDQRSSTSRAASGAADECAAGSSPPRRWAVCLRTSSDARRAEVDRDGVGAARQTDDASSTWSGLHGDHHHPSGMRPRRRVSAVPAECIGLVSERAPVPRRRGRRRRPPRASDGRGARASRDTRPRARRASRAVDGPGLDGVAERRGVREGERARRQPSRCGGW